MAKTKKIPSKISHRLDDFFDVVRPNEFRDYLIEMFYSYMSHEHESLPSDFKYMAESMMIFLDFLKFAQEEYNKQMQVSRST